MTSPARIAANRLNALRSTGPRTPAGKLVVAQNAVRHGVFAHLPVVPGEREADWQTHRQGVLDSLTPVGLLEVTLAERVALFLWRMARLAKYEALNTVAAVEDAGLLPPDFDPIPHNASRHFNNESQLRMAEQELRRHRELFFGVQAEADFLRAALAGDGEDPLSAKVVGAVLVSAYTLALETPIRRYEVIFPAGRDFLNRLGFPADWPTDAAWPRANLTAALDYYAGATEWPPAEFRAEVLRTLDSRTAECARGVRRREAEVFALNRRLDAEPERVAAPALLPPAGAVEQIIKLEKHLHAQLTSTLHELERLQARRGGEFVVPPAVADLFVSIEQGDDLIRPAVGVRKCAKLKAFYGMDYGSNRRLDAEPERVAG